MTLSVSSIQSMANGISNTLSGKSAFTNNNDTLEEMSFGQQLIYFFVLFIIIYYYPVPIIYYSLPILNDNEFIE